MEQSGIVGKKQEEKILSGIDQSKIRNFVLLPISTMENQPLRTVLFRKQAF